MLVNIIGAGRVGKNIACALVNSGNASLGGVFNNNMARAEIAVQQIGSGIAINKLDDLPDAELTFITTPDDCIARIVTDLTRIKRFAPGRIVVHCSGVLSSGVLSPLREQQCFVASLHPLKAFRTGFLDANVFGNCDCVLEGDAQALTILTPIFRQLGANLLKIHPDKKASYHAAAVMASNYLVTLAANAVELFIQAGMESIQAKEVAMHLMQGSLDNIRQSTSMAGALTGPLERGDIVTLRQHLQALNEPSTRALYEAAALATLPLTTLSEQLRTEVRQLFLSQHLDQAPD